jgi:signal transduction histidine kinase
MTLLSIALAYRVYILKQDKLQAEKKALETDKLRSLIHVICHDLRNPLTVISYHAESQLSRGNQEWAPIVRAAKSQQEILTYVRLKEAIESGKHKLEMVPVKVADAAENARFLFEGQIKGKNLQWHTDIEPDCTALADPTLFIHTVVANLVSNAIKFTPDGGKIELIAATVGKKVLIEVRDSGIGIPSKLLPHLFSGLTPTTRPGTNGERGNGFGMPLVKTVVESFNGTISVESVCADEVTDGSPTGTCVSMCLRSASI